MPIKTHGGDELLFFQSITKTYKKNVLLRIENFSLHQACAYVLTGMNGAGKSVLLRILAGLETTDSPCTDVCRFLGQEQQLRPYPRAMRDAIIYVHQHPLMLNMTVEHNINYGLRMRKFKPALIVQRTDEVLHWAGLANLRNRYPIGLSGGEKQKIALARAKILSPKLLLLDEPTANLDGQAREQVIALIPTLIAEGSSVVMACHDRDLIHLPHVRHLKLRDGRIEDRGIRE